MELFDGAFWCKLETHFDMGIFFFLTYWSLENNHHHQKKRKKTNKQKNTENNSAFKKRTTQSNLTDTPHPILESELSWI